MNVNVIDEPIGTLRECGNIPIAFEVRRILDVTNPSDGSNDFVLTERL
ncbi:MAG TPA: hypothetical protein VJU86_21720 [Pyrinomonadaceae bacterium]|nr:hypothetical protein [Pyrinomonadaceae bacterium]